MDISREIQSLFNPKPIEEEEDFEDSRTVAKVVETEDSDLEDPAGFRPSSIRQQNATLLDELDNRYSGAVVKRKSLQVESSESENSIQSDVDQSESDQEEIEDENGEDQDEEDESAEDVDMEDSVAHFSQVNMSEEVEKGKAVRAQLKLWDTLLAARIKLQRLLVTSNRLPQGHSWEEMQKSEFDAVKQLSHDCQRKLEKIVNKLLLAQDKLFSSNSATRFLVTGGDPANSSKKDEDEITSEEEEEIGENVKSHTEGQQKKRQKYNQRNGHLLLAKRHKSFQPYQNDTLLKWHEKTKLASGKFGKNFQSFDQNVLKQIDEILSDRNRLVKRTQLKRSDYEILGKPKVAEKTEMIEPVEETITEGEISAVGRTYDEEIFDDDDFYQHLLRELIERKATSVTDPVALGRHWIEIQKFRKQIKKKVDTKASKGRKIRYDVQPKLVNFMAPIDNCKWNESSRQELFGSLFGHLTQI